MKYLQSFCKKYSKGFPDYAQILPGQDFYCSTDVVNLWIVLTKVKAKFGSNPLKRSFEELVKIMVNNYMKKV
ncbi:MAG: hypothetical protein PUH21_02485 [Prevotellaceae bacterium]|nr:hypothetical protein [Prevotellaceae bacterium]MDY3856420.1 hypothetical protein [Bacteroidaceae bacterium]